MDVFRVQRVAQRMGIANAADDFIWHFVRAALDRSHADPLNWNKRHAI